MVKPSLGRGRPQRVAFLLLSAFLLAPIAASAGPFGLGVIAGEPTGVSLKLHMNRVNALDGGVAWSVEGDQEFTVLGDYLYHNDTTLRPASGLLLAYFGIGGRLQLRENRDDKVGVRFPIGATYLFPKSPFDIFFEAVPILDLNPETEIDVNIGVGGRYYFGGGTQLHSNADAGS